MVYISLNGRFGNYLFQIAAAASLARRNNSEFAVACHENYLLPDNSTIYEYIQQFKNNIFKNITILKNPPSDFHYFIEKSALFEPIPYLNNIFLHGTFQSEKYFDKIRIRQLFAMTYEIRESLLHRYGHVISKGATSIHVRRGDYLNRPHEYNVPSMGYFKRAIDYISKDACFLIVSDDIKWCKKNFRGTNYYFADNNTSLEDLYLQSLCKNNIISNSTFSWWGAWLNDTPGKIVIAPKPWYGKSFSYIQTDDLLPQEWLQIENKMTLFLRIKAKKIRIKDYLRSIGFLRSIYHTFRNK